MLELIAVLTFQPFIVAFAIAIVIVIRIAIGQIIVDLDHTVVVVQIAVAIGHIRIIVIANHCYIGSVVDLDRLIQN